MILVTGATGMFGSRVVREAAARGLAVRALAHTSGGVSRLAGMDVKVAIGDLDQPETLSAAFQGIETALFISPMDERIEAREANALRAAQEAGVRRVVKLYGAVRHRGDSLDAQHRASIAAIRASGLSWALVSPNSVMETSLLSQAGAVREAGALFGCAGGGRVGLVAADDVAKAAAVVLSDRRQSGVNYELTGPAALTMDEVAAVFSDVLERRINYQDMPEQDFRTLLIEQGGISEDRVDVQVMLHFAAWRRGDADLVTDTYRELTGQPPTSLQEWTRQNRAAFDSDP